VEDFTVDDGDFMELKDKLTCIGLVFALIGGCVALFNAWKAVLWKRAELASGFLKQLTSDESLVFACRAMDWKAGRLVVPENLTALLHDDARFIVHEPDVLKTAMRSNLYSDEMEADARIQLYRTTMDDLLSWLSIVSTALERGLFTAYDAPEIGYWVRKIRSEGYIEGFIDDYGYGPSQKALRKVFRRPTSPCDAFGRKLRMVSDRNR
jgi:hypothetical protein